MRFYHYKELLKLFAINRNSHYFESTRNSVYAFLIMPSITTLCFNIIAPFSVLRPVGIYGVFGATIVSFFLSFKEEMHIVA